ncbi:Trichodiene oxygenase [Cladophialophora carrionii]|uniref:Trichodiene oxygenase n=1 Tax=Cladophialophora carrionii TaxID=86049 RepID=A0A1C1CL98_9EURO|nr:Trichodiene oxygenase [Cladophialophora carrionii]
MERDQSSTHLLWVAALAFTGYLFWLVLYRLYLSPLARFPGPKLAAFTAWYEFYYDAIRHGKYTFEIARMHRQYGPIVRISPWELHIDDPEYYEVLYSYHEPRNKYKFYANMFGNPKAAIAILDHSHHRLLRSNMNPYFSTKRIRSLEPEIQALVDKLCHRLNEFKNTGVPVTLQHAYTCFATDVVSDYTMGTGFHYLDEPDFIPDWSDTLSGIAQGSAWFKPLPWLLTLLKALPQHFVKKLNPGMGLMFSFQDRCGVLINSVIENQRTGEEKQQYKQPTFFHDVLASDLPPEEKSAERLAQEIQVVIGAGAETVAKMLSWTTYYLLENPEKLKKLQEELNGLDPDRNATLVDFEKMPYLTSVMLEGLRLSYGVSTRLARIAPDRALQYREYSIPAGTPVGMTSVFMHHNEGIFPDSYNFIPERWMDLDGRQRLEQYLVAFSKGSRQCIGLNLARAEMLLVMAKLFRDVHFQLYETTREDVTLAHELFLPFPKIGSKGVRVLVTD